MWITGQVTAATRPNTLSEYLIISSEQTKEGIGMDFEENIVLGNQHSFFPPRFCSVKAHQACSGMEEGD